MQDHETDHRILKAVQPILQEKGWTAEELASLLKTDQETVEALLERPSEASFSLVKKFLLLAGFRIVVSLSPDINGAVELK